MATSGRHLARRSAVQALYQWDITGQDADRIQSNFIYDKRLSGKYLQYFIKLINGVTEYSKEIDELICKHTERDIAQIDPLEKAILRVGTYEVMHELDVPHNVVVNEAIEIAKLFCSDQGYKFVNGVLDKIAKAQQLAPQ